jgi:hypothetical protein
MVTDPFFYRLFKSSPETLFLVLGMSAESASGVTPGEFRTPARIA